MNKNTAWGVSLSGVFVFGDNAAEKLGEVSAAMKKSFIRILKYRRK